MTKSPKQQAQEMAEKLAEKTYFAHKAVLATSIGIDDTAKMILKELNLEQLIEDKMRLDWLENFHYSGEPNDFTGTTYFVDKTKATSVREAISTAMKKEGK